MANNASAQSVREFDLPTRSYVRLGFLSRRIAFTRAMRAQLQKESREAAIEVLKGRTEKQLIGLALYRQTARKDSPFLKGINEAYTVSRAGGSLLALVP